MTDWKARCGELEGLLSKLHEYVHSDARFLLDEDSGAGVYGVELDISIDESLARTRAELAQPEPVGRPWPVPGDAEGLAEVFWGNYDQFDPEGTTRNRAKQRTSQSEPKGLTDEEILALSQWHGVSYTMGDGRVIYPMKEGTDMKDEVLSFARAVWSRVQAARPAIEAVSVNERPWEREGWCNEDGKCWFLYELSGDPTWTLEDPSSVITFGRTHSLPHHALPVPVSPTS